MVAKRKAKDEVALPAAALDNPYALLSREELDAALREIDARLLSLPEDAPERKELRKKRSLVSQGYGWLMVRNGTAFWGGGKPRIPERPIEITPGPPISDLVHQNRR